MACVNLFDNVKKKHEKINRMKESKQAASIKAKLISRFFERERESFKQQRLNSKKFIRKTKFNS